MTKDVSNWPGLSAPGEFCVQRREVACFIKMFIMHCMHSFQHPSGALWFLSSFPTTVFLYPCELSSLSRKVFFFILFIICHVNILQQDESSYTTLGSYGSWHAVLFCFFMCVRGIGSLRLRFSPGASTIQCTIHPPVCFVTLWRCTFVPGASLRVGSFFFYVTCKVVWKEMAFFSSHMWIFIYWCNGH